MFIITLGDVFGLIILAGFIIYILYIFIDGIRLSKWRENSVKAKPEQAKVEHKPEPEPKKPLSKGEKIAYVFIALLFIALFIGWKYAHDHGL